MARSEDDFSNIGGSGAYSSLRIVNTIEQLECIGNCEGTIKKLKRELENRFKYIPIEKDGYKRMKSYDNYGSNYLLKYRYTGLLTIEGLEFRFFLKPFEWTPKVKEKEPLQHPDKFMYTVKKEKLDKDKKKDKKDNKKKGTRPTYTEVADKLSLNPYNIPEFYRLLLYSKHGCRIRKRTRVDEDKLFASLTAIRKVFKEDLPQELLNDIMPDFCEKLVKDQNWNNLDIWGWYKSYQSIERNIIGHLTHNIFGSYLHTADYEYYESTGQARCYHYSSDDKNDIKTVALKGYKYMIFIRDNFNLTDKHKFWNRFGENRGSKNTYGYETIRFNTLRQFLKEIKKTAQKSDKEQAKLVLEKLGFKM